MSDQNNQNNLPNEEIESTIFSDPAHFHDDAQTKDKSKRSLTLRAISVILVVCIVAMGAFLADKFIPRKAADEQETTETVIVTNIAESDVASVTVENELGSVVLNSSNTEVNGVSTTVWSVEGVKTELVSSDTISSFVKNAIQLTATEKIAIGEVDYGFDNPSATVKVKTVGGQCTLTIGKTAPGEFGYYCKSSLDKESIDVINGAPAVMFNTATALDFAATDGFSSVKNDKNESCFSGESITQFDYIKISGKKHAKAIKIIEQEDEDVNAYFAFKMVEPSVRICDNTAAETVLKAFSGGFANSGAYAYSTDKETLKKYGLDNPDYVITLSLKGEEHTLKFSVYDETYAAFIDGKTDMVQKVALSSVSFATTSIEGYYSGFITLENLTGLKAMKVETPRGTFTFDIKYNGEVDPDFDIKCSGNALDLARFKDYYGSLVAMTPISYEDYSEKASTVKITFIHSGDLDDTVLTFNKSKELRYLASIDGIPIGQVTSSSLDTFIEATVKMAKNEY